MVRFVRVIAVQHVELWVGFIAECFIAHIVEVKMKTVQQEMNFDPRSPGVRSHSRRRAQDEGGAVHCTTRLILELGLDRRKKEYDKYLFVENKKVDFCHFANLLDMAKCALRAVSLRDDPPPSLEWHLLISSSQPTDAPPPPGRKKIWRAEGDPNFGVLNHIQVLTRHADDPASAARKKNKCLTDEFM